MSVDFYGVRRTAMGAMRMLEGGPSMNLNNGNAATLLRALGIPPTDEHGSLCGDVSIVEARRGVVRAKNTKLYHLGRPEAVQHGKPVERDGIVELRPVRYFSPEFTADDILERVVRFAELVEQANDAGAERIGWS